MRIALTTALAVITLTAALCAGCTSGNSGQYAAPAFLPQIGSVTQPAGTLTADEVAEFSVSWLHGREPFTVTWNFGDGADPAIVSTTEPARTHTVHVTAVNETDQPMTYEGGVAVQDFAGESSSTTFTYVVEPAP
jgi:hypothetical protein